jgi:tetratricopeptide (TPR) repeat protein
MASFLSAEEFDELGHEMYDSGEYERALEVLREGLGSYPDDVDLLVGMAYVRLAREEFAWALHAFESALRIDEEHEDAWVGLGETLLKFGRVDEALACFDRVDDLGVADDLEVGLAIGRALYREGLYEEARDRFDAVADAHPESAQVRAALAYALHAVGSVRQARRELGRALRLEPGFHEARIFLGHLLHDLGEHRAALLELEKVPPSEHWDPVSIWRVLELLRDHRGVRGDGDLQPWRDRLAELQGEPDEIDHLLAEVEVAFDAGEMAFGPEQRTGAGVRVRTADGAVLFGSWEEVLHQLRDVLSGSHESPEAFMIRTAEEIRRLTGWILPCDDAEAFLRESVRLGFLQLEEPPGSPH